jgi:hypothetical protein
MAGRPVRNLSVCCAASQSGRAICAKSGRSSPTAIIIATPITAKAPSCLSKIMREQSRPRHIEGQRGTLRRRGDHSLNFRLGMAVNPGRCNPVQPRADIFSAMPTRWRLDMLRVIGRAESGRRMFSLTLKVRRDSTCPLTRKTSPPFNRTKLQFSRSKLLFNGAAVWPDLVSYQAARPRLSIPHDAVPYSCQADGLAQPHPPSSIKAGGSRPPLY